MKNIILKCPHCQNSFETHYFHAGFSDVDIIYCNTCPNAVKIDIYDPKYTDIYKKHKGLSFVLGAIYFALFKRTFGKYSDFQKVVERELKPCSCGGIFLYRTKPRCPICLNHLLSKDIKKQWKGYRVAYAIVIKELFKKDIWKK
ncbi:MAG: hypothetical protein PHD29_08880 [bacterium]|nr:hypothetical protein [bacterium]